MNQPMNQPMTGKVKQLLAKNPLIALDVETTLTAADPQTQLPHEA